MTAMRISELARRSGVPSSTLRYYGQLGLLPAERTAAGYRVYDEAAHQRLMFIEAAKRLQLSLPAIADLLTVWQSDACRAVKQQLRPLLQDRIAQTDAAIAELHALRDHLVGAHARLDSLPDRDHRCDPDCAFLMDEREPVVDSPSACSLDSSDHRERIEAWRGLLADAHVMRTADGFVATLRVDQGPDLTGLIVAEQACCSFLGFTVTFIGDRVRLTVTGPADAQSLITELADIPDTEHHTC